MKEINQLIKALEIEHTSIWIAINPFWSLLERWRDARPSDSTLIVFPVQEDPLLNPIEKKIYLNIVGR
jgi:hypothetical protein